MKILACDRVDAAAVAALRAAGHEVVEATGLKGPELIAALRGTHGLLVRGATKVTADVLEGATDLRVVVRAGTGLDNVDVAAARARGVVVRNTPNANSVSVAEMVFALALALERHVAAASGDLRHGTWEKTKYMGRELAGRTLGVLGFGRIGREVALRARAFEMQVIAHDPLLDAWPEGFAWVRRVDRDTLLSGADVLSLHVPLTPGTKGSFGADSFARMRPDAILVNASRGGVVDERALEDALRRGALRGAALDVFEQEPPGALPLLELPNVLATPHLGASTAEAQRRAGTDAAEILLGELASLSPR